jgi:hypothetical protein
MFPLRRYALLFGFIFICGIGYAQTDSLVFIRGLPQTGDTLDRRDTVDYAPSNDRLVVDPVQLPPKLIKVLDSDAIFSGWRNAVLEKDRNTGHYWVYIPHNEVVRVYVVNDNGDVVRMEEMNKPEE